MFSRMIVKKGGYRNSIGSRIFDVFNYVFLTIVGISTLYIFWDAFVVSLSPIEEYLKTSIHLWPSKISFEPYKYMLNLKELWISYGNTLFITVAGTSLNMAMTIMTAYVLSKKHLLGQRAIMFFIVFTMLFSGGVIPLYIVIKNLKLMNTLYALIIPSAMSTYNLIILRNFFKEIPASLEESALLDGCTEVGILFKIVIPISKPAIMTIALFYAVGHWNQFFAAVLYIYDKEKWPLQLFLRSMLFESDMAYQSGGESLFILGQPMKMAAVMMAVIPIMCAYPFFQKYFVKGVMVGSVKG